jgi:hypothetical protein
MTNTELHLSILINNQRVHCKILSLIKMTSNISKLMKIVTILI